MFNSKLFVYQRVTLCIDATDTLANWKAHPPMGVQTLPTKQYHSIMVDLLDLHPRLELPTVERDW